MAIPDPQATIPSHQETLTAMKEVVDILAGQRRDDLVGRKAVTWDDLVALGLIQQDQVPRK